MMRTKDLQDYGTALIVSGPSGAGKTLVCKGLVERMPDLHFSVSCTTRPPRQGEQDGVDYHFLDRQEFSRWVESGQFLESAEVHGHLYGTLRAEVEQYVAARENVLLDIDVQGARQVRKAVRGSRLEDCAEYAFIGPPSYQVLEARLRGRATETEKTIRRRLRNALSELKAWREYDYLVINDDLDDAVAQLHAILQASANTTARVDINPWPETDTDADK